MEIKRFEFPAGGLWTVKTKLTHGMVRRVQEVLRDAVEPYTRADSARANDALLLAATESWSYGTVTQEALESIPEEDVAAVLGFLNTMVGTSPLVRAASGSG